MTENTTLQISHWHVLNGQQAHWMYTKNLDKEQENWTSSFSGMGESVEANKSKEKDGRHLPSYR